MEKVLAHPAREGPRKASVLKLGIGRPGGRWTRGQYDVARVCIHQAPEPPSGNRGVHTRAPSAHSESRTGKGELMMLGPGSNLGTLKAQILRRSRWPALDSLPV